MCAIIGFDSPTLTEQEIRPYFDRTISRGPDMSRMEKAGRGMLGFHRLAIMGLHEEGMQPFHLGGDMAVCNGELYGFRPLKKELEQIDKKLPQLNTQRNTLEEKLATSGLPAGDIVEAGKLLSNVNGEIEQLEERWLELSEQIESIQQELATEV